jgi:hypothetical protein
VPFIPSFSGLLSLAGTWGASDYDMQNRHGMQQKGPHQEPLSWPAGTPPPYRAQDGRWALLKPSLTLGFLQHGDLTRMIEVMLDDAMQHGVH